MPVGRIENIGRKGMFKDVQPHEVPTDGLVTAKNLRIEDGAAAAMSGIETIIDFDAETGRSRPAGSLHAHVD